MTHDQIDIQMVRQAASQASASLDACVRGVAASVARIESACVGGQLAGPVRGLLEAKLHSLRQMRQTFSTAAERIEQLAGQVDQAQRLEEMLAFTRFLQDQMHSEIEDIARVLRALRELCRAGGE